MYFHSAFYIFGMTLVFVQCHHHREGDFHEHKSVPCEHVRSAMNSAMKMTRPMPRDMPVQLKPQAGHKFKPDTVYIPQCTGSCKYGESSMPMKTEKKPVHVMVTTPNGLECASVELEEHKTCKCGCLNKPEDCNTRQWWDAKECACKCANEHEKMKCKMNMFWNPKTCECECTYMNMECSNGYKWNREDCGCMQILQ